MQIQTGFFGFPLNNTENIFHRSLFFTEISDCSLCAADPADQVLLTTVVTAASPPTPPLDGAHTYWNGMV